MSEEKPTEEVLPTGETVFVHPDGVRILKATNRLADMLAEKQELREAACAERSQKLVDAATAKREAQADGDPVPADKRAI